MRDLENSALLAVALAAIGQLALRADLASIAAQLERYAARLRAAADAAARQGAPR